MSAYEWALIMLNKGHILDWSDFAIAPFYILLLIAYTWVYILPKYKNTPIQRYILPGLFVRILGCILSACMYQYYYNGGDTFHYFKTAVSLNKLFWENPASGLDMIFTPVSSMTPEQWFYLKKDISWWEFQAENTAMVCRIGAIVGLFTFRSYLAIGLVITYFSFLGCWKLFLTFYDIYPKIHRQLAISTLFIPSVFFWGAAGLMKDTIVIASLGYFTYGCYNLFIKKRAIVLSLFQIVLSFFLMFIIKIYIAIAFIPALIIWVFLFYEAKIKDKALKLFVKPMFLILGLGVAVLIFQKVSSFSEQYTSENALKYAMTVSAYLQHESEKSDGSAYDLGEIEPTPMGLLKIAPAAINVTLFRPYLWETKKPIILPSALEAAFFLFFTLYIFFNTGLLATFKYMFSDPNVLFCLTFAMIFAFAVGFSTSNFGTLARYKIPAIPFYFIALFVMYNKKRGLT